MCVFVLVHVDLCACAWQEMIPYRACCVQCRCVRVCDCVSMFVCVHEWVVANGITIALT